MIAAGVTLEPTAEVGFFATLAIERRYLPCVAGGRDKAAPNTHG
jgi:hypothetical protein